MFMVHAHALPASHKPGTGVDRWKRPHAETVAGILSAKAVDAAACDDAAGAMDDTRSDDAVGARSSPKDDSAVFASEGLSPAPGTAIRVAADSPSSPASSGPPKAMVEVSSMEKAHTDESP